MAQREEVERAEKGGVSSSLKDVHEQTYSAYLQFSPRAPASLATEFESFIRRKNDSLDPSE